MMNLLFLTHYAVTCDNGKTFLGLPVWYKYLTVVPDGAGTFQRCKIVLDAGANGNIDAFWLIGLAIVEILLRLAALIAVGFVVSGGVKYITSNGNADNAKQGRQTIINAMIGLVIAMVAASVIAFLGDRLSKL